MNYIVKLEKLESYYFKLAREIDRCVNKKYKEAYKGSLIERTRELTNTSTDNCDNMLDEFKLLTKMQLELQFIEITLGVCVGKYIDVDEINEAFDNTFDRRHKEEICEFLGGDNK